MAVKQVNPTRMELTRLKKKLNTATRGHKLLKDKRDELMRRFLEMVRENRTLRMKVEEELKKANGNFVLAKAAMSDETLKAALLAPKQEVYVSTSYRNVMSVDIPVFDTTTRTPDPNDIYSYGFAFTSSELDDAVKSLADILDPRRRIAELCRHCDRLLGIGSVREQGNLYCHIFPLFLNKTQLSIIFYIIKAIITFCTRFFNTISLLFQPSFL